MSASSLYIHIPFCAHKCLFCSFAIAVAQTHRAHDYLNRLDQEARAYRGAHLDTVYVGGGTPSMLSVDELRRLMGIVREYFSLSDDCEMTIEANPEGVDEPKARLMKELGFNRFSLGIQSLDDRYLKFLGRWHDAWQAKEAYALWRKAGFENINLDLMYAFPSQTKQELETDVRAIASLGSEHLSLYTLTIEPYSRFYAQAIKLDDDDKIAGHYQKVVDILQEYGFGQYEISNFSKAGFQSRHNKNYWRGGRYIGLGMGAHGFTGHRRYWNTAKLQEYLNSTEAVAGFEDLDDATLAIEKVLFGLRMNEGIDPALVPSQKKSLMDDFVRQGFLKTEGARLKTTDQGRLVLDELSVRLI
ncbi:MAG: radical SAM family heme chaperone HemW [Candidatus Omnitrophica bacterium]|nr:radical SAM family heme chaperone HemW [Candidatus Omnitrophota bacterium]